MDLVLNPDTVYTSRYLLTLSDRLMEVGTLLKEVMQTIDTTDQDRIATGNAIRTVYQASKSLATIAKL